MQFESVKLSYPDRKSPATPPQYKSIAIFLQDDRAFLWFGAKIFSLKVINDTKNTDRAPVKIRVFTLGNF
jgi:hypothetical protein